VGVREALAGDRLAPEVVSWSSVRAALEEGRAIRRRVALVEDLVAGAAVLAPEEVVEADLVEAGGGRIRRGWPPMPENWLFARRTIATAFQRMIRRIRARSARPGERSCSD
jgi:hypothetical protein